MLKALMDKHDSFILTEKTKYKSKMAGIKTYHVMQVNREEILCYAKLFVIALKSLFVFLKERPDVVISMGVLATIPICLIAKLLQKKLIYIESFAKITSATQSGKFLYKRADLFYVQWESMTEIYPNAIYLGGIY